MPADIVVLDEFDSEIQRVKFDEGITLADAVIRQWPQGFRGMTVMVMSPESKIVNGEEAVTRILRNGEEWHIILRPQTGLEFLLLPAFGGALGGTTWLGLAITAVSLVGSFLMAPKLPRIGAEYEWDDSDKPQFFSAQSNQLRAGSRVPDILGKMRVWPDLIAEPWVRYSGDSQELRELYVVSKGYCEVTNPLLSDESIYSLPSSDFNVYQPSEDGTATWPAHFPIMRSNAFVGAVELPAENETITFGVNVTINTTGSFVVDTDGYFDDFTGTIGEQFAITYNGIENDAGNRIFYTVTAISADGKSLFVSPSPSIQKEITDGSFAFRRAEQIVSIAADFNRRTYTDLGGGTSRNYTHTDQQVADPGFVGQVVDVTDTAKAYDASWYLSRTFGETGGTRITNRIWLTDALSSSDSQAISNPFNYVRWSNQGWNPDIPGTGFNSSIFRIPGQSIACAFDIEFPSGLYQQAAGGVPQNRTVELDFYYRVVGTDTWTTKRFAYSDLTRVGRRFTSEINWADEGESITTGEYECYFSRVTDWVPDTGDSITVDGMRLIGLRGQQDVSSLSSDILNSTLVELILTTQNAAQVTQNRSFNVIAERFLPNYLDGDGTSWIYTRQISDALMYTILGDINESAVWNISEIDVEALKDIQGDLNDISAEAGQFNGIIDQTMTLDDQLSLISSVGRITTYRRASNIYFNRLKGGVLPRTLINSRNKVGAETKNMTFFSRNEPDAIVLRFMDEDLNYDESSIQYPADVDPINPQEDTLLGITNAAEAQRVAQYLWDKRKYERDGLTVSMTEEGLLLGVGDVIAVTDFLKSSLPIDGEVLEFNGGSSFTLDQPIPDGVYIARLRDKYGEIYATAPHTISGGSGANGVVNVPSWSGATPPSDDTHQVSLLYSFTPVDDADSELQYVVNITPTRDGPVEVTTMQYTEDTYQSDGISPTIYRAKKRKR